MKTSPTELNIFEEEKISSGQSPHTRPRGRPKQQCLPVFDMNHGTFQSSDTVKSTSSNRPDSRHPSYRVIGTTRVKSDQLSSLNSNKLGGLNKASNRSTELIVCKPVVVKDNVTRTTPCDTNKYWQFVHHSSAFSFEDLVLYRKPQPGRTNVQIDNDDGSEKSNSEILRELNMLNCSVVIDRIGTSKRDIQSKLKLYLNRKKIDQQIVTKSTKKISQKYQLEGRDESPGIGYLRCCNCKEWFKDAAALTRHTKQLIQCNLCMKTTPAGYNNYEKPYFCTKTELQLHFRGKHTKEYLEMVSAVTGKPAGKEVQLGRHNHLKANLNIKASQKMIRTRTLITDPIPTNHYNKHNRPGDLSICNYRKQTFKGTNFKVHIAPEGGWRTPRAKNKLPYSSSLRNGRFKLDDVKAQATQTLKNAMPINQMPIDDYDEGCTIEVIEEDDDEDYSECQGSSSTSDVKPNIDMPQEHKPDFNVTPPITITKIETLAEEIGKVTENKLSAPVNDEVPLTKLVDEDLIDAIIEDKKDNEEKISNKRKLNTPVKIEDAIKTETAVIEVNEEVNESVKKPQMIAVIPDSAIRTENKKAPLKFIPLKLTDGKLIDAIPLKKIKVTVRK